MKATGIIRKIDELGRIVIPKEIRRTLRIRQMDAIEIYTSREGEIILKKYSPMAELTDFAKDYAESLASMSGLSVCITDREQVIAAAGNARRELIQKPLSQQLENAILERRSVLATSSDSDFVPIIRGELKNYSAQIISPIISEGDALGSVVMLARDKDSELSDTEYKMTATAADFLGRHMAS